MTASALQTQQLQARFPGPIEQPLAYSPYTILQPELSQALNYFTAQTMHPIMMVQTLDDLPLTHWLGELYTPVEKPIYGFRLGQLTQWQSLDFVNDDDLIIDEFHQSQLVIPKVITRAHLLGSYPTTLVNGTIHEQFTAYHAGMIWQANHGILALNIQQLLREPLLWNIIWQCVTTQTFNWRLLAQQFPQLDIPDSPLQLKLILFGDCLEIEALLQHQPLIDSYTAIQCELLNDIKVDETHCQAWLTALYQYAKIDFISHQEVQHWLLMQSSRASDHQSYLAQNFSDLAKLLQFTQYQHHEITVANLETCAQKLLRNSQGEQRWSRRSYADGQIKISLQGKTVGQINGLSVVEMPGIARPFGEPLRITATIEASEGDLNDVERKAELAGNIHAKSMMIIQGYLNRQFAHDGPFPVSGTIVFEQSYQEIDGDSASLAGLMAVLSALSNQPLDQQFATTGAIDQMGNVLAVGGINEKIEGFYEVCQLVDPGHSHCVIIPAANLTQLNLNSKLCHAVENGQIKIFPVEHVDEAIALLFNQQAQSDDATQGLLSTVNSRAHSISHTSGDSSSVFYRLWRYLRKKAS